MILLACHSMQNFMCCAAQCVCLPCHRCHAGVLPAAGYQPCTPGLHSRGTTATQPTLHPTPCPASPALSSTGHLGAEGRRAGPAWQAVHPHLDPPCTGGLSNLCNA